jgi:dihydroorotase
VGELRDSAYASVEKVVRTVTAHRDLIAGLKVRLGDWISGPNTGPALEVACAARDAAGLPLAVHVGNQPIPLPEVLRRLQAGDILTHVLRGPQARNGLFDPQGRLLPEVWAAQQRSVVFDLPATMSKLLALGLPLEEIIPRVTATPARVLARCPAAAGIGSLGRGAVGDLAILEVVQGRCTFRDSRGTELRAERRFVARAAVRAGRLLWRAPRST